jgi:hypothetical protein
MRLYAVPARALREEKNGATRRALASHSLIKKSRGGASKKSPLCEIPCPKVAHALILETQKAICSRINKVAAWIPDIPDALLNADGREREEGDDLYWPAAASLIYIGGTPCASRICI